MEPNSPQNQPQNTAGTPPSAESQPASSVLTQNPPEVPQPVQTAQSPNIPTPIPSDKPQSEAPPNKKKPLPIKLILIGGGVLLILVIILGIILGGAANSKSDSGQNQNITPTEKLSDVKKANQSSPNAKTNTHLMVYGAWTGQTSVVKTVDLTTSTNSLIATLPLQIKKITVMDNKTLMYIDQTDTQEHGKRISLYSLPDRAINESFYADEGYYINDYILSPDKKYLSIWELSNAEGTQSLQGGHSRVYAIDLTSSSVSNLIFDEDITTTVPVHYPSAILNDGTILADTFMANDPTGGGGWEYGMSTVDFDGTNRKDIEAMQSGTYSSQPKLSADGKYLLFTGYDGSKGEGTKVVNGYRQALLTPDTVEVLNTKSLQRFRLPNVPDSNTYSNAYWDLVSGNAIITAVSSDAKQGVYMYDLGSQKITQMAFPQNATPFSFISQLAEGKTLIGIADTSLSNFGNLGEHKAYAFNQVAVLDTKGRVQNLSVEEPFVQYITILPANYFPAN